MFSNKQKEKTRQQLTLQFLLMGVTLMFWKTAFRRME
ncbi:hypothetical protein X474_14990 [Dethiosulfatarculus sandiegensis]|uniref:Uncharacterized protein n=1 Tax=Dethiosulfatarculus sandiegensis TaxID=1429043 RepID=A0A0D2GE53_9BACT|nr:hypothetical protein X474_14990 [Dethiosulfatarculus sandiegensis]